ncbi:MAG: FAD-dependent oxidoreductase [Rhodospirillaceae bacterium]|nr:FAD-dependent oxidoreductase [Rhodospirillaceae bacterium]
MRTELDADAIREMGADTVVLATGSEPTRTGFQRIMPHIDDLPGVGQDNVCTVHDVLDGSVVPGNRVLLLDDINGWWPASGTAQHLALQRHEVTVVTAAELACAALDASQAGETMRERFMKTGVEVMTATALLSWNGNTAEMINLYTGDKETREFDSLVLATTNTPNDQLTAELAEDAIEVHAIGDTVSSRTASMALYEARKLAVTL